MAFMTGSERAVPVRTDAGGFDRGSLAWLLHPVSVLALMLLLLNDQVLKSAWPGMLTGKLSDFAGLALAPPFITVTLALLVPRLAVRVVAGSATVVVGTTFALVKTTAVGAAAASAAWSWAWGPSTVLRDPTDLLALPALALSWWAFGQVREQPLPRRAVELISAVIVLPTAGLALLASSAVDYPNAGDIIVQHGSLFVNRVDGRYGEYAVVTTDGERWSRVGDQNLAGAKQSENGSDIRSDSRACVPAVPRHCYRTVPQRLAVEESVDGGATWTDAWSISPGRQQFLERAYPGRRQNGGDVDAEGIGILPVGKRYVVVVAIGRDGLLMRHPDGRWERIGFPTLLSTDLQPGSPRSPAALTERGQRIPAEYIYLAMGMSVGLLLGGLAASPRSLRSWWLIPLSAVLYGIGLPYVAVFGAVLGVSSVTAAMVLIAMGLVLWVKVACSGRALGLARGVVLAALGAAVILVGAYPFVEWSAGRIDSYERAQRAATILTAGGVVVMALAGLGFAVHDWRRRPRALEDR
jgi:hypothetical protein